MAEGDSAERLSARRESAMVLRIVVEAGGRVTGELVDPVSQRRRRFTQPADLVEEVRRWIDDAVRRGPPG